MATLRLRRVNRAALLQATALRAAFVVVFTSPAAAQLPPGAHPTGGTVVGGQATIGQNGNTTTIDQASQRAAINWQSFNVGSQQTVDFVQPNSHAIALNTVVGANPSEIAGRIDANGQIVIVNQSGVVFDHGAQVDTEGLTVSAAGITNQNFMAGHMVFNQAPHPGASITNAGTITVNQAGLAALVAPRVANSGVIHATLGRVILAGAATYTLDLYGDGLLALNVTSQVTKILLNGQTVPALVTNTGTIIANGGTVVLTASAADGLIRTLVNAGGTIAANSVGSSTGTILAQGIGGSVEIDGDVTATGTTAGTRGGQIVANATGNVTVDSNAVMDVSGDAGGGLIAIGTSAARASGGPGTPSSMIAGTTTIAAGAQLRANATGSGHGGRITVLSRQQTNFAGTLAARGGTQGGNGGWVELSSLGSLNYNGAIDTSAPLGIAGNILIDPTDLEITSGTPLTGFSKLTPAQVHAMTGAVDLSATDTLLLQSAVTPNSAASSFELDAGILLIIDANFSAAGIPVTLMGGTTGLLLQGGTVTASTLTLMSQAVISQTGGAISATSLTGSAAGDVTLQGSSNSLTTLGAFTSGGEFYLTDSLALTADAAVTAADGLALIAPNLTIATTGTLSGGTILLAANQFDLSGGITATGMGRVAIDLLTAGTLTVGGAHSNFSAAGLANIVAGTLALGTIGGPMAAPQTEEIDFDSSETFTNVATLGLFATGLVTDAAGGIKVADLFGVAGTATLTGANTITTLNSYSTTASAMQFDDSAALTIAGDVTGATGVVISGAGLSQTAGTIAATSGDVTLTSTGSLAIGGTVTATSVTLGATGGDISESGAITATSLTGSASGAVALTGATNDVADLTALTATAGAVGFDDATNLSVTGPVTASAAVSIAVSGTGHTLGLAAGITGADVTLTAQGSITETSGLITANTTTIALASAAGGVSLGGTLDAVTSLSLTAGGGNIAETAAGVSGAVTATLLSGSASGAVTLDSGSNDVGVISGLVASRGAVTLDDATLLSVTAPITAGGAVNITLTGAADTLGLAANVTGSSVTLTAPGSITQTSGIVTATATDVGLNSAAGGIALGGTLMAAAAISLNAGGGDIVETFGANTGTLLASSLSGSASGMVTLDSTSNSITTLASLTATAGALMFDDAPNLTITGPVTASGDITIASTGALSQSGNTIASTGGDVSLSAGSSVGIGGTVSGATVTLGANGGDITETVAGSSGSVTATTLDPSATGAVTLGSGTNDFAAIGAVSIGTNLSLADTVPLDITVALRGDTLSLSAPSLTIAAGGGLTGNNIVLRADTYDLLAAVDGTTLVALGLYTPGGTLTIGGATSSIAGLTEISAGTLALGSLNGATADPNVKQLAIDGVTDFSAIAPVVGLFATGLVSDAAGGITAASLYGIAGTATLNGANSIATLLSYSTTAGTLQISDNAALTIAGDVTGATGVLISAAGLDQTANTIAATTGGLALESTGALAIGGTLTAATLMLGASGGNITESGAITATSLSGSASGAITLDSVSNDVGSLATFTASTGAADFADAENLSVTGPVNAAGAVAIAVSGGHNTLGIAGNITGSAVSLSAPGAITQTAGTVQATAGDVDVDSAAAGIAIGGTLSATAGTVSLIAGGGDVTETVAGATTGVIAAGAVTGSATAGSVLLTNEANQISALGAFPASGSFEFSDADAVTVTGAVSAGASLMLQGPGITVSATGSLAGTPIILQADAFALIGGVSSTGLVAIDLLTAGTLAVGGANDSFGGAGLGAITAGTLALGSLNGVTADANVQELDIDAAADLAGHVGMLGLFATGLVTDAAGGVTVADLYGSAGTATLTGGNVIGTVVGYSTSAGLLQIADNAALTITGDVTGATGVVIGADGLSQTGGMVAATTGDVTLASTGALVIGGTLTGAAIMLGASGGDITESGAITATSLSGSASGALSLDTAGNDIGTVSLLMASAGAVTLDDASSLSVTGPVSAASAVTIAVSGTGNTLGLAGNVSGSAVTLTAPGAITQSAGVITATLLSGSAGADATLTDSNDVGTLAGFTAGAAFAFDDATSLSVTGPVSATEAITIQLTGTGSTLDLAGNVSGTTVTLTAPGAITQSAGVITATSLSGNAGADVTLTDSNDVGTLAAFTAGGAFAFDDASNLSVTGPVSATDALTILLSGTGNTLSLAGDVSGSAVTLTAPGAITQIAGVITATSLSGSAGADATLTDSNDVGTLAGFTAGGAFAFDDAASLVINGSVSASIAVTLTAAGAITQLAGVITATSLSGSAGADATLTDSNDVGTLAAFVAGGAFAIDDAASLSVTGPVSATDAVTIAVSGTGNTLDLAGNVSGSAVTLTAPGAITQSAGVITATSLSGSAGADATLTDSNDVGTLAAFTAGGAFAFDDASNLSVTGPVSATDALTILLSGTGNTLSLAGDVSGSAVTLTAPGAITQSAGVITATSLSGSAGADATLTDSNDVGTLAGFTAGAAFAFDDATSLSVTGPVSATEAITIQLSGTGSTLALAANVSGSAVTLTAPGAITQSAGVIMATSLSGSAGADATLTDSNNVGTLAGFTTGGAFAIDDAASLVVGGPVSAADAVTIQLSGTGSTLDLAGNVSGSAVTLTAPAAITQSVGVITATSLNGSAGAGATLTDSNDVGTLAGFTAGGAFTFDDAASLVVDGPVSATDAVTIALSGTGNTLGLAGNVSGSAVTLTAPGAITQSAGVITATSLSGSAGADATLTDSNDVGTLAGFTAGGAFAFDDASSLSVIGPVGAVDAVTIQLSGIGSTLRLAGDLSGSAVTLTAPGAITQSAGVITATSLSGSAGADATLTDSNDVGTLAGFVAGGAFAFDDAASLSVTGPVSATDAITIQLTGTGSTLDLAGNVTGSTVTLTAPGAITQSAGVITATSLSGSAGADATLTDSNDVGTLAGFAAGGAFAFDDASNLSVAGPVSATDALTILLSGTGNTLSLAGNVSGSAVTLTAPGAITQSAGVITATSLSGSAGADATLTDSNDVGTLAGFAAGGAFAFDDAASLVINGSVSASTAVTLTAAGAITQLAGVITATSLSGSAGAGATLTDSNDVGTLAGFTAGGAFAFDDAAGLMVDGPVSATDAVTIQLSGTGSTLDLAGNVSGSAVTLTAPGAITQSAGVITATSLSGSAGADATLTDSNDVGTLAGFTAGGAFTFDDAASLVVDGRVSATDAVTIALSGTGNTLSLAGDVSGSAVTLTAPGAITQTAGVITATWLSGSAGADATLTDSNDVGTLAGFTAGGAFAFDDAANLVVIGPVSATDAVTIQLSGTGSTLDLAGNVSGTAVTLTAPGAITQSAGVITAASLSGSTGADATLTDGNDVGTLAAFTAGGAFAFDDASSLSVTGPVSATDAVTIAVSGTGNTLSLAGNVSGSAVTLTAPGAITQAAGVITATSLSGSAGADATLTDSNDVGTLAGFTAGGAFAFDDAASLVINGSVSASTAVTLTAAGAITQLAGVITATSLSGSAGTDATLTDSNDVGTLAAFVAGGAFAFDDASNLSVTGPVSATGAVTIAVSGTGNTLDLAGNVSGSAVTLTAAGAITQSEGVITATSLSGSAGADATLTDSNDVGTLAGFTAGGAFTFDDAASLVVDGPVSATDAVTVKLSGTGNTLSLAGDVSGGAVTLTAPGAITQSAGVITATSLSGSAGADATLTDSNDVATLAGFTAGGAFAFDDASSLSVTGPVSATDAVTIAVSGSGNTLGLAANVSGSAVTLTAPGAITQSAGSVQAKAGNLLIDSSAASITIGSTLSASGTAALLAGNGAIDATGDIIAAVLTGGATGAATFSGANQIAYLGDFTAAGFSLRDTPNLAVTGTVNGGAAISITDAGALTVQGTLIGSLTALTAASIIEPGAIDAATLTGSSTGTAAFFGTNQIATLGNFSAAGLTLNDAPNLAVTGSIDGGTSVLITDAGNLTIPGTIIAASTSLTAASIGETGSIRTAFLTGRSTGAASFTGGNQVASLGNFTAAAFMLNDAANLAVTGTVAGGASIVLTDAGSLAIPGTLIATSTALTAATIGETGSIQTATLTGDTQGNASFTGTNNIAALDRFNAGAGALLLDDVASLSVLGGITAGQAVTISVTGTGSTLGIAGDITGADVALAANSSITQTNGLLMATSSSGMLTLDAANLVSLNGGLDATTIAIGDINTPRDVDLNNVTITTGSNYRPGTPKPTFPKTFPPGPVADKGFFVYAKNFLQTGFMKVNGNGAAATVDITISGSGTVAFDPSVGLEGPSTELFLNLAHGTASGHIVVAGLNVSYTPPGAPNLSQLTGVIGGLNGQPAAGTAYIMPLPNSNYRINACAIQSVDCILLSPVVVPVGNPTENVEVDTPRRRHADDDLVLPNVSEEDF